MKKTVLLTLVGCTTCVCWYLFLGGLMAIAILSPRTLVVSAEENLYVRDLDVRFSRSSQVFVAGINKEGRPIQIELGEKSVESSIKIEIKKAVVIDGGKKWDCQLRDIESTKKTRIYSFLCQKRR